MSEISESLLFEDTIRKVEFMYKYMGINIRSGERTASDRVKSRCVYIFNFFWLNFDVTGGICWFVDRFKKGKDFFGLTYIAPCISLSTLANLKSISLILNEERVHKLIDSLKALEIKENSRSSVEAKKEIMKKERDYLHFVINVINILNLILIIAFAVTPLFIIIVKYMKTQEVEFVLPFLILYPFNPFDYRVWPFVYLHQFWSECVACINICSVDNFFIICCSYLRIQFRLLRYDIESLSAPRNNIVVLKNKEHETFVELILRHQELIDLVRDLESIYSKSTLFNFTSSSLIICLTGFNVAVTKQLTFMVIFLTFLFMSLAQIFFLCHFADRLATSSVEISNAVYNTQWYMTELKFRKQLLLVQIRAQKPCKVTACGYADVNLHSFMKVLSTAWSYFALLQTIYGD